MRPFIWLAVALLVVGGAALVADVATSLLWLAFVTIGMTMVVLDQAVGNE